MFDVSLRKDKISLNCETFWWKVSSECREHPQNCKMIVVIPSNAILHWGHCKNEKEMVFCTMKRQSFVENHNFKDSNC